jgi:hypothetical protein
MDKIVRPVTSTLSVTMQFIMMLWLYILKEMNFKIVKVLKRLILNQEV